MKRPWVSLLLLGLLTTVDLCLSQPGLPTAILVNQSVVDNSALTIDGNFGQAINGKSFQQDALVTHKAYQYIGFYDHQRQVCIGRRKLPNGHWDIIRFSDYDFQSNDAHNTISLGICPVDGTIHIAFDHHGDTLHYRVSQKNVANQPESIEWHESIFSPIRSHLQDNQVLVITYPRFWQTPDGHLQFGYRRGGSGNGDRMLVDYDPELGIWKNTRQIDSGKGIFRDALGQSSSRCSYPNGYQFGPNGKLHTTWVWRESSQGANHDLIYVYSEDQGNTWFNNLDQKLPGIPHVQSPGIIAVEIGRNYGLMNTHGQTIDSKGRIHVVMWHCTDESLKAVGSTPGKERWGPPEARYYHHYWRSQDGHWNHTQLPMLAGSRPKIFADVQDNLYLIYGDRNQHSQQSNLNIVFASAEKDWIDWEIIHRQIGPFVNEMLADPYLWYDEEILSILVQDAPAYPHERTALKVLDFKFE